MDAKRGFVPEDIRNFSEEAVSVMKEAARHVLYLINEGYDMKPAVTFVGNHFQLSERQRLALMRSLAAMDQLMERKNKEKSLRQLAGQEVWIDGFNTVITLEVMLSDSILIRGMDGCIRDLAALRGTYRLIPETTRAARMLMACLEFAQVKKACILLDEPVSNSGRLKALLAEAAEEYGLETDIRILKDVDRALYEKENVITSDSIILDHCKSWVDLTAECVRQRGNRVIELI